MKKEEKSLFEKLYEASEEQASRFAKEVVSHPSFSSIMEKALRNAMEAKGKIDKNVDQLLGLLNIPSKSDYRKLLAKVEALQGSLVNLNIKIDRLSAALEKPRRAARRKTKHSSTTISSKPTSPSPH
jgi:ATP-dependent exoDNAse (exonuclease V) alpha subunit